MIFSAIKRTFNRSGKIIFRLIDKLYTSLDRRHIRETKNTRLIPPEKYRRGGKHSYAEWAQVIGIFQTIIYLHLNKMEKNLILDVGCGTGILAIACEPFLGKNGRYTGLDVNVQDIDFCRSHYPSSKFSFKHHNVNNPFYSPNQKNKKLEWNLDNDTFDFVTALSVWTHLNEEDSLFYFKEINRVLKPNGKALITLFLLDDEYKKSLKGRSAEQSNFHMTSQKLWIFDQPVYGSDAWFYPKWVDVPEHAIGVTNEGLNRLITDSNLRLEKQYTGYWKEIPGPFFQDVLIFQKS